MNCPECGAEEVTLGGLCKNCVDKKRSARLSELDRLQTARQQGNFENLLFLVRTNIIPIILFLLISVFALNRFGVFGWGNLPNVDLAPGSGVQDPCKLSENCMIAYVAPWCPSCRGSIGFLNSVHEKIAGNRKLALKIVIGMDDKQALQSMAGEFKAPVFFDLDGAFASNVGIYSVPSVLLANADGKIAEKGLPGAISGLESEEANVRYYLKNILNLDMN